jgi:Phosphate-starvation-inducible E family
MPITDEFAELRARWRRPSLYQKFEHVVILILIAVLVVLAVWILVLKSFASIFASGFDPTDYSVFQAVFGMIFTVIIALESNVLAGTRSRPARRRLTTSA